MATTMRVSICSSYQAKAYRLFWLNESKSGVFLGFLATNGPTHLSYHADGTKHSREEGCKEYYNQHRREPIATISKFEQVVHVGMDTSIILRGQPYSADERTETTILIEYGIVAAHDTLALDLFLLNRVAEVDFVDFVYRLREIFPTFALLFCNTFALTCFPEHKVGVVFRAANTRQAG